MRRGVLKVTSQGSLPSELMPSTTRMDGQGSVRFGVLPYWFKTIFLNYSFILFSKIQGQGAGDYLKKLVFLLVSFWAI